MFHLLLVACCLIYAALARGIWLDEFWSLWLGDPHPPLIELVRERWLRDTNPPPANMLYWLASQSGAEIGVLRIVLNAPAFLLLSGASFFLARRSEAPGFHAIFLILLTSLGGFAGSFADFRSYFWQICATAVFVQIGHFLCTRAGTEGVREQKATALIGAGAIMLGLSLHFVTGIILSIAAGLLIAVLLKKRASAWAAAIAASALVAWIAMIGFALVQSRHLAGLMDVAWVATPSTTALLIYLLVIGLVIVANPLATWIALRTGAERLRKRGAAPATGLGPFAIVTAGTIAISALLLLALNAYRPIIVERYLVTWQVLLCALISAASYRAIIGNRIYFGLFLGTAILMTGFATREQVRDRGWNEALETMRDVRARCPTSSFHAMSGWHLTPSSRTNVARRENAIIESGYRRLAARAGLPVTIITRPAAMRVPVLADCPTLIWIEHFGRPSDPAAALHRAGVRFTAPAGLRLMPTGSGMIVVATPRKALPGDRPAVNDVP